jgi:hypothetical protein
MVVEQLQREKAVQSEAGFYGTLMRCLVASQQQGCHHGERRRRFPGCSRANRRVGIMRRFLYCLVQSLLLISVANISVANAQPATRALRDFDLLGRWAVECTRPASPLNEHSLFSLTSVGMAWVLNDFGPDYDGMVYRIVDAKRVAPDKLSLRQVLTTDDSVVLDMVIMKDSERIRIWSSQTADGNVLVRDGMIASGNDQRTRWAGRCGEKRAMQPGSPLE